MRISRSVLSCCALAGSAALVLAGCSSTDAGMETTTDNAKMDSAQVVHAVATTTQICDYLTHIAATGMTLEKTDAQGQETTSGSGDVTLDLTCLLAPNASAHEHEMTPKQMKALGNADLFFVNGVDLEHFLDSAISSSGFKGTMAVTSGVSDEKGEGFDVDLGVEKVEVREWPFIEPGETPEFTHDPHIWTDPKRAAIQVTNIGSVLTKADPAAADVFKDAVDTYKAKLDELDQWVQDSINSVPQENRTLFTSHDAFGYFSESYGVKFVGAALSDFNHQQDATADHIQQAAEEVKASGARALFAENSNNSKSIEAIARVAGVKAITDEDALYGDSLGPVGSAGETYIGSIIHNVTTLVEAWDGTVAPLPASLQEFAKN
ncbi:metal ABC transporter substrate-binding protein [Corynebacterium sp. ES2794-CONJ1]|uniref:metal ABC transporter substrate-binding protein n=1 Tax=unclassified Corynebacterium TaxID=2624378 RepID=UPI002167CD85|nr:MULTISPECIES: metal ABC transporter substrate-binding protein [unclassified Corynebacterium]MCS4490155.1 metal ABC transporter substrate-binding protein [Corynebacterium sp. ES2775-CONJ]MCS4492033.1 metal ABC transporter substrate-binding protein [Corynebacterium sp. ES2715-CONJ3]MCS4532138.1 metal ABC transporter substrate-binding protein [Corynebacterium sp. ES2730-CONJ]MCU9519540.1 metal ABC transporter substrate-binding protein [Corynebacterium sp. ES2794-CONJ1]